MKLPAKRTLITALAAVCLTTQLTACIETAIIGAVALYTVLARFVYLPMSMLAASYLARAQDYRMQPTTHRRVDLRRGQPGFSFAG